MNRPSTLSRPEGRLAGRRVLYTGASGGLGHQTTLDMLAEGAEIFALDRDHAKNESLLADTPAIYPSKPFEEYSMEDHRAVHAVNVEAALICTKAALGGMRAQGWGRIINVTSITLNGGWENLAPYVQSKGALLGLTRAWAREFGKWGITCNAIAPGAFPTDAEKIHPDPAGYQKFVLDHQAVKRRGTPHNPTGNVWSADDLRAMGEICARHDILVIAEEIHQDIVLNPALRHRPFASRAPLPCMGGLPGIGFAGQSVERFFAAQGPGLV